MIFEGVLVGGPNAGRWLSYEGDVFRMATYAQRPPKTRVGEDGVEEANNFDLHFYHWRMIAPNVCAWVYNDMSPDAVFRELIQCYHPNV